MFFYDNKILDPYLAPNWFTKVKVIEKTPNPRVSERGPLHKKITLVIFLHDVTAFMRLA